MHVSRIGMLTLLVSCLMGLAASSHAAGWNDVRDRAMSLREKGQASQAYTEVAGFTPRSDAAAFDREFVAGWIALRSLNRADVALGHFKKMAAAATSLRASHQAQGKAKAGYWIGRALRQAGRTADSKVMFNAAAAYATTFYGQLSASEAGLTITKQTIRQAAENYPIKKIYWHDTRVRVELVLAVIREESRFRQHVTSSADARGMMQVLDGTAMHVGKGAGVRIDTGLMKTNADYNIAVGSRYLAEQLDAFGGNPMLAAAAYNAGPQRVEEWLVRFGDPRGGRMDPVDWAESIPFRETRDYVQKVISSYVIYLAINKD